MNQLTIASSVRALVTPPARAEIRLLGGRTFAVLVGALRHRELTFAAAKHYIEQTMT